EYKLNQVLAAEAGAGVEGQRRAIDAVLGIIALAPRLQGQAGAVKTQLMVTRIARRLNLKEETVWARLEELRQERGDGTAPKRADPAASAADSTAENAPRQAKAAPEELDLLRVLLADPNLVSEASARIRPEE